MEVKVRFWMFLVAFPYYLVSLLGKGGGKLKRNALKGIGSWV